MPFILIADNYGTFEIYVMFLPELLQSVLGICTQLNQFALGLALYHALSFHGLGKKICLKTCVKDSSSFRSACSIYFLQCDLYIVSELDLYIFN